METSKHCRGEDVVIATSLSAGEGTTVGGHQDPHRLCRKPLKMRPSSDSRAEPNISNSRGSSIERLTV